MLRIRVLGLVAAAGLFTATPRVALSTTVPDGFVHEVVVSGPFTGQVVGFAFLPDGRPLTIELKSGVVRLSAAGSSTADSILTIPGVSIDHPERGLLGVVVDPGWPARPYVYFHYTHTGSVIHVVMYTASGDLTDPASTAITLGSPYFLFDDLPDVFGIHNAGTLRFGPDGMLYVSVGDDAMSCDPQDITRFHGKLLRLDVSSMPGAGSGPPPLADITPTDNPFPGPDPVEKLVYAWGLRNPFRFTIDAPTGDLFIGDVGSWRFEEINYIPGTNYPGYNFGWPQFESGAPLTCCGTCGQGNTFTFPIDDIPHPAGNVTVVAGPVWRTGAGSLAFPATYEADYLYFELYTGNGHRIRDNGGVWDFAPAVPGQVDSTTWCGGFIGIADVQLGTDGAIYMAALGYVPDFGPGLHRIRPVTAVPAPVTLGQRPAPVRAVPNPVHAGEETLIRYETATAGPVRARIYDAMGRLVETIADRAPGAGSHEIRWKAGRSDGSPLSAGVYFVRLDTPRFAEQTAKVVVVRR